MCFYPTTASLPPEGGRPKPDPEGDLKLPCGKCDECISKRASEWALRCKHEMAQHEDNCFLTLTYSPENLNSDFIVKTDFQKFIKKLRKKLRKKIRYIVSYEYGTINYRPHMHAIIFGYQPPNQTYLKHTSSGYPLTVSEEIENLWQKGFHSIGEANEKTAYYIAAYALKGKSRTIIHPNTGEETEISDAMDASKRPAIGLEYFKQNKEQLINSGEMLPRYYLKKLEEWEDPLLQEYQDKLAFLLKDRTPRELYAKQTIDRARRNLQDSTYRKNDPKQDEKQAFLSQQLKQDHENYKWYMDSL